MKLNKIFVFFAAALPISVLLRLFQIRFTVDMATGFFKREEAAVGILLLCLIGAACLALAIFSRFAFRMPEIRKKNLPEAIASLLCAGALIYELASESFAGTVLSWQLTLLTLVGIAAVLVFLAHSASLFAGFPLPKILFLIPPFYFIVQIICTFTSISSLALISDYILLMATYCVGLLFFLNYGKLQNDVDPEHTFRKFLGSGLCFTLLAATQSLPYFVFNFLLKQDYPHTSLSANLSALAFGIFAAVSLFTCFCGKREED